MNNEANEKKMGGWAFLPFIVLIGLVLFAIIFNSILGRSQAKYGFPILSVTLIAAVVALMVGPGKVDTRLGMFCKGSANPSIMLMILIFLFAGAFTAVSSGMGAVVSLSNFCLSFIPKNMIYAGILLVTSLISFSIGTSVGTVTAMAPIALGLVTQAGLSLPIGISAVVGGAIIGDNLSFVSDTTIAATRGIGVEMKDKFKMNIAMVLPGFICALVIYGLMGVSGSGGSVEIGPYNIIKIIPYVFVIVAAICGMNVMTVLLLGIAIAGIIGFCYGDFTFVTFLTSIKDGMSKMSTVIITNILIAGIMGVIAYNGGVEWLINKLTKNIKTSKGAQYSISALAFFLSVLLRSTSAIVMAAPLAKDIGQTYKMDPRRTASLLDIFATMPNGFVFWEGLNLVATGLIPGITTLSLARYGIYSLITLIVSMLSIQFNLFRMDKKKIA